MPSPLKNRSAAEIPAPPDSRRAGKTTDWSDAEILARCRQGQDAAWTELVDRYGRLVYFVARRYGLDTATSDDVFQEVYTALLAALPRIQQPDRVRSWLLTTAHRVSRRHRNRSAAGPLEESLPIDDSPAEHLSRLERHHLVRQALKELGGRCQKLLEALFLSPNPMEYDQVARDLHIPVGSVGPTRARCLAKLLEVMERLER